MITIQDNVILRDGENIGTIDGETAALTKEQGGQIKGQINKAAGTKLTFVVAEEEEKEEIKPTAKPPVIAAQVQAAKEESDEPVKPRVAATAAIMKRVKDGLVPQPPPTRPDLGQTTPEYVAWFKQYGTPEEIAAVYPPHKKLPTYASHQEAILKLQRISQLGLGNKGIQIPV